MINKIKYLLLTTLLLPFLAGAQTSFRAQDSITVINGKVDRSGLIADESGQIFVEFPAGTVMRVGVGRLKYEGEILPPEVIELTEKKPRFRMREFVTFELLGDTAEDIFFLDQFRVLSEASRRRFRQNDPDNFFSTTGPKLFLEIYDTDEVNKPALWLFRDQKWKRLGGALKSSSLEDVQVFSAALPQTGLYSIFDEQPPIRPVDPETGEFISLEERQNRTQGQGDEDLTEIPSEENIESGELESELFPEGIDEETDIEDLGLENLEEETETTEEIPAIEEDIENLENLSSEENISEIPSIDEEGFLVPIENSEISEEVPSFPETPETNNQTPSTLQQSAPNPTDLQTLPESGPEAQNRTNTGSTLLIFSVIALLGASIYTATRRRHRINEIE